MYIHSQRTHVFAQSIDVDNSGAVAYSEFLAASIHSSHVPKKDKLGPIFSRLDVDGNGALEVGPSSLCTMV